MEYRFFGADTPSLTPLDPRFSFVRDQRHFYALLSRCWSADTCAPRMRGEWSEENKTLGQCSITAFLVQDIFGGEVYGVPLSDGNFHCFNNVNGVIFDLTSEQFGDEALDYEHVVPQSRETHFAKAEKRERYEALRGALLCLARNS